LSYPVYSERAVYSETPNVWKGVTVPENHRFVIKTIAVVNNTAAAGAVIVNVHGVLVINDLVPAASSLVRTSLHVVAYEREGISTFFYFSGGAVQVNGFLFKDDGPRIEFPPIALLEHQPAPLPAGADPPY